MTTSTRFSACFAKSRLSCKRAGNGIARGRATKLYELINSGRLVRVELDDRDRRHGRVGHRSVYGRHSSRRADGLSAAGRGRQAEENAVKLRDRIAEFFELVLDATAERPRYMLPMIFCAVSTFMFAIADRDQHRPFDRKPVAVKQPEHDASEQFDAMDKWLAGEPVWPLYDILDRWGLEFRMYRHVWDQGGKFDRARSTELPNCMIAATRGSTNTLHDPGKNCRRLG